MSTDQNDKTVSKNSTTSLTHRWRYTANYLSSSRFIACLCSFANWAEVFFTAPRRAILSLGTFQLSQLLARKKSFSSLFYRWPATEKRFTGVCKSDSRPKVSLFLSASVVRCERGICARRHAERELICEKLRGIKWFLIKFQAVPMADGARRGMNKGIINLL